jgi:hypothetical protein
MDADYFITTRYPATFSYYEGVIAESSSAADIKGGRMAGGPLQEK